MGGRFSSLAGGSPTANIPSPTRPWIKLAKETLELEEDELIYNYNEGQGQRQGGHNKITHKFMKNSNRGGILNSSGKEYHKRPSTNELADVNGLRPTPATGEGSRKERETLDSRRQYMDQKLNNLIIEQPFISETKLIDARALFPGPTPGLSSPFSHFESVSSVTSHGAASAFKPKGKAFSSLSTNDTGRLVNNHAGSCALDNDLFSHAISLDETEEDCRVLSDEIAATLPSPVAVMFPLPSDHMSDGADCDTESKKPTDDSVDDGKMSQYISTMATSIAADILRLRHRKLACILEPSPLQLLVRMQGN